MDPQQGAQPDLLIGQTIGNYLVTQKLGEGGMGSVYLAEHPAIGKKVALKVLHSEFSTNQDVAARFFNEAKAVNDIGHPNIVDIVDFGIIQAGHGREQLVYFIMEYLAGVTLSHLVRAESPLPPERAFGIAMQVADALAASHKCGIVHRDLKPDNIILLQRGRERDFVKLLDFGIAKLTGSAMGSHRTRTGIVMGTPAYMSPEQCEGRDTVDLRTDIYALGIVLYEMLTGRVPFLGEGYGEVLVQHLTQRPVPPSQYRMLPPHVELVVMKALEKRADMRYPSMEEFMRAMADPMGYVESHGGVTGFLQRQLTPSTGPLPLTVRLTPAPPTPPPGTLIAPTSRSVPPVSMTGHPVTGHSVPPSTAAPTTLGTSAGQVSASRGKTGFIVAAVAVVAVAAAAIIAVAGGDKGPSVGSGSGSAIAEGSGSAVVAAGSPGGSGSAVETSTPSVPGTGSAAAPTGSAAGSASTPTVPTVPTGSDSGSAESHAGSDTAHTTAPTIPTTPADEDVEIKVNSTPPGAAIWVNNSDTGKITPDKLRVKGRITVSLRLHGYTSGQKTIDVAKESERGFEFELAKLHTQPPPPVNPPTRPPGNGHTGNTSSPHTDTSSKPHDQDGLMKPGD